MAAMAGSMSSSFSVLSCVPQNLIKGRHSKRSAFCRIPSLAPTKTVSNLLALDSIHTEIFSVNWSHHRCLTPTSMQLGPDIDDGWGFIEALLGQIT